MIINTQMNLKTTAIVLVIVIVVNLVLFVMGKISQFWFWIIMVIIGFIAYKVLPKLKDKKKV